MKRLNPNTKQAQEIVSAWERGWSKGRTIWEAYARPSAEKVEAFQRILRRAVETEGYNGDIRITGASCQCFSTMYSFTDEEGTHIVWDTPSNTREVVI
jgi:hypothetical protein